MWNSFSIEEPIDLTVDADSGGQVTALVSYGKVPWDCIEQISLTSLRRSTLVRLINWFCHILVAWASSHLMLDHNVQFGHHLSFGQWWWRWSEFFVPRKKVNSNLNNKTRSILVLYGMPPTNDLMGGLRVSSTDCGPVNLCCPFRSSIKIDKNRIDSINGPLWIEFYFISLRPWFMSPTCWSLKYTNTLSGDKIQWNNSVKWITFRV